jgi:2-keto-4-pentenoate hydratase/2-oxohepta-3-ene-1,7-dioic acid hydratase in catechol pathway
MVSQAEAYSYIDGYCLALDMTSPSLLREAKENGLSWDIGKGLDGFLPLSEFLPASRLPDPHKASLELLVNGEVRQLGDLSHLKHKVPFILEYISSLFTLNPGDLVLTGTPPNSSEMKQGDHLHGKLKLKENTLLELFTSIS